MLVPECGKTVEMLRLLQYLNVWQSFCDSSTEELSYQLFPPTKDIWDSDYPPKWGRPVFEIMLEIMFCSSPEFLLFIISDWSLLCRMRPLYLQHWWSGLWLVVRPLSFTAMSSLPGIKPSETWEIHERCEERMTYNVAKAYMWILSLPLPI